MSSGFEQPAKHPILGFFTFLFLLKVYISLGQMPVGLIRVTDTMFNSYIPLLR